jgi:hypothetical protein
MGKNEWRRSRTIRLREAGLCTLCGHEPAAPGALRCPACQLRAAEAGRRNYAKNYASVWRDPLKLYKRYRRDAIARGLDFSLCFDDFEILVCQPCMWCGLPDRRGLSGLDRIDRLVGYGRDNCLPACQTCNYARGEMAIDEYLDYLELMAGRMR